MIIGLGSVGCYLLDYLISMNKSDLEIIVVGRNKEKMESDVNIVKISALIRNQNKTNVIIDSNVDLNNVDSISLCLTKYEPDIVVNSSRAYSGLKYGSISWNNIRAYGIWAPLSIKYIKNIMLAYEKSKSNSIVINTSYSDATIAWLKSAGVSYPDFGSGNINHLIPRIKYAISEIMDIPDYWNIDIEYATSHFHDVVISKEGQSEGVKQLIIAKYNDKILNVNFDVVFTKCKILMPTDSKRNMMNASSNYEIINGILNCINGKTVKLHIPGAFGEIGGYPVILDGCTPSINTYIDETYFSLDNMREANRKSIYLDGIENIDNGILIYTDELCDKVKKIFNIELQKRIRYSEIENVAQFLIDNIVSKYK